MRSTGARIKFISDGDVAGAIMAASPHIGVDITMGVGGTPEGVLTACALRAMGGEMQTKLWFADDYQKQRAVDAGHDLDRVLTTNDLVRSENAFFVCTGITDGELLEGVRYTSDGAHTQSLVMRAKSGTLQVGQHLPRPEEAAPGHPRLRRRHYVVKTLVREAVVADSSAQSPGHPARGGGEASPAGNRAGTGGRDGAGRSG